MSQQTNQDSFSTELLLLGFIIVFHKNVRSYLKAVWMLVDVGQERICRHGRSCVIIGVSNSFQGSRSGGRVCRGVGGCGSECWYGAVVLALLFKDFLLQTCFYHVIKMQRENIVEKTSRRFSNI